MVDAASEIGRRGLFVVFEGIDGSGSTTQGEHVSNLLRQKGRKVLFTHEPSGGPAGALIRLALAGRLVGANFSFHDPAESDVDGGSSLDSRSLALLYAADRSDHTETQIRPSLQRGRSVVCDRYIMSSLVYQGLEFDLDWLLEINSGIITPDVTFFIDVPVRRAMIRMRRARWTKDLYEDQSQLERVRQKYLEVIESGIDEIGPVIQIDGSRPKREVRKHIRDYMVEYLDTGTIEDRSGVLSLFDQQQGELDE